MISPLIPTELPQLRVTYTKEAAEFIGTRRTSLASIGQSWYRSLPGTDYPWQPDPTACRQLRDKHWLSLHANWKEPYQECLEYTSQ